MEDDYIGLHKINRSLYNEKKTLSKILVDERKAHELDIITLAKAYRVRGKEHRARQNALSRRNKFEKRPAPIKILLLPTRNITSWPHDSPTLQMLALIGFLKTRSHSDNAPCAACGVNLYQWQLDDDPAAEHETWALILTRWRGMRGRQS